MKAWGRLLRLSLAPTAIADVAAGAAFGAGGWPWSAHEWGGIAVLALGSLAVYHGGMVLNDWADRDEDRLLRPDRPIPSGAVRAEAAFVVGAGLLFAGPLLACTASAVSARILLGVSAAAFAYDLRGRGPRIGPLLLGFCRAGNLAAGIAYGAGTSLELAWLLPAAVYGGYVFAVSRLARLEDAPASVLASSRPPLHLALAALLLASSPVATLVRGDTALPRLLAAFALAVAGAGGLLLAALRPPPWTATDVTRATGLGLRRLLVFTAALALAQGQVEGPLVAAAILLGYPLSYALRGTFPPS